MRYRVLRLERTAHPVAPHDGGRWGHWRVTWQTERMGAPAFAYYPTRAEALREWPELAEVKRDDYAETA